MNQALNGAEIPVLEPISPELALVSDELGARARAALPERPWELFAGPGRTAPDTEAGPDTGAVTRVVSRALRTLAWAIPVGAAGVVLAVVKFGTDSATPAPTAVAAIAPAPTPGVGVDQGLGPIGAVQSGGYVFADGVLQVGKDGTSVSSLSFTGGCANGGSIEGPIPLRGRLFRFSGRLEGAPIRVVVTGVFFKPTAATLLIDLRGGRCGTQTLRATARLS